MATFKKRGTRWTVEIRKKGRAYRAKTFENKAQAKDWAVEEEHRMSRSGDVLSGKTFGDGLRRYLLEETPKKKGARWETIRIQKLEQDSLAAIQFSDLSEEDIENYKARRAKDGLEGSSINRELGILSTVLVKARKKWKWIAHNPLENVEKCKEPPHRNKIILDDERDNILLALGYVEEQPVVTPRQVIAVAFLFAIETAARYGEIWKLDWKEVYAEKRYMTLLDTKNGDDRNVDLSKRAIELLNKLGPEKEGKVFYTKKTSSEVIFRRALELAGYKDIIHFHDTRHTALTRLAAKLDPLALAKMSGHRDPRMLMIYYNPLPGSNAHRLD